MSIADANHRIDQIRGNVGAIIAVFLAVDYLICLASWKIFWALSPMTSTFLDLQHHTATNTSTKVTANIIPAITIALWLPPSSRTISLIFRWLWLYEWIIISSNSYYLIKLIINGCLSSKRFTVLITTNSSLLIFVSNVNTNLLSWLSYASLS